MTDLHRKTALVTGASRGIGRATALALAERGARVGIHYATNVSAAEETATAARASGGEVFLVRADLGQPDGVERIADAVAHLDPATGGSGLDILVHNAAVTTPGTIRDTTAEALDRIWAVNVRAHSCLLNDSCPP